MYKRDISKFIVYINRLNQIFCLLKIKKKSNLNDTLEKMYFFSKDWSETRKEYITSKFSFPKKMPKYNIKKTLANFMNEWFSFNL